MKVQLTILSPVHIGTDKGNTLSPYGDYIFKDGKIFYIDHDELEAWFAQQSDTRKIIDEFVHLVRSGETGGGDKYTLRKFFDEHRLNVNDFCSKVVPVDFDPKSRQISRAATNAGRPFIPGSTLKGTIRNAALFDYLKSERGKSKKEQLAGKIWDDPYNFTNPKKPDKFYDVDREVLGSIQQDILRYLQVTDTQPFDPNRVSIVRAQRVNLKSASAGRQGNIPLIYETIASDSSSTFTVRSTAEGGRDNVWGFKVLFKGGEEKIFRILNQFTLDNLERELEVFSTLNNARLLTVRNFCADLQQRAKTLKLNEAIFRIGMGKRFFFNTISLLLGAKTLEKLRRKRSLGINRRTKQLVDPFPITETIIYRNNQPAETPGWVKIEKLEG